MKLLLKYSLLCLGNLLIVSFAQAQTYSTEKINTGKVTDTRKFIDQDVSMELPVQKGVTLHVVNSNKNLDVQVWAENKVKLITKVAIEEGSKNGTPAELLERAGISMRTTANRVELNSRNNTLYTTIIGTNKATFYGEAQSAASLEPITVIGKPMLAASGSIGSTKRNTIILFVPENTKVDIDSRSSDIMLRNDFVNARFDISNSNLDCQNVGTLKMLAKYSNVNAGNITNGEVEFENGSFRATNITNLDIDSKSSSIEYEEGTNVYLRSQRDNYSIESIGKVEGRKLYGELRINKLLNSFDLEGTNADVKIRNISVEVEKVKMVNQYADIRLPVKSLHDYKVDFEGSYSTVFAPFEKTVIIQEKPDPVKVKGTEITTTTKAGNNAEVGVSGLTRAKGTTIYSAAPLTGEIAPAKFTANVGTNKQKQTSFTLSCNSCTIDFK